MGSVKSGRPVSQHREFGGPEAAEQGDELLAGTLVVTAMEVGGGEGGVVVCKETKWRIRMSDLLIRGTFERFLRRSQSIGWRVYSLFVPHLSGSRIACQVGGGRGTVGPSYIDLLCQRNLPPLPPTICCCSRTNRM